MSSVNSNTVYRMTSSHYMCSFSLAIHVNKMAKTAKAIYIENTTLFNNHFFFCLLLIVLPNIADFTTALAKR